MGIVIIISCHIFIVSACECVVVVVAVTAAEFFLIVEDEFFFLLRTERPHNYEFNLMDE